MTPGVLTVSPMIMAGRRHVLNQIIGGGASFDEKLAAGDVKVDGRSGALGEFFALLDDFGFWSNIVTPRPPVR